MTRTAKHPTLLKKIGIGGLSFLIFLVGASIYGNTMWRYRLVLRDEPLILGAPAPFVYAGVIVSCILLLILWCLSIIQNRHIGWGLRERRTRSNPLLWEDIILFVVPGSMVGTVGTALFINSYFDK